MKASIDPGGGLVPSADALSCVVMRRVAVSWRSRVVLWLMRLFIRRYLGYIVNASHKTIAAAQLRGAGMKLPDTAGLPLDYRVVATVPGHVIGTLRATDHPVILWIHGGAFLLPAAPIMHLVMVARLCRDLGADAFVPDYRLATVQQVIVGHLVISQDIGFSRKDIS